MLKKIVTCRDLHRKEHSIPSDQLRFRPSAYALMFRENEILLSPQWDGYDFPGGGIDLGETIEEALRREVFEETGVHILVGPLVDVEDSFFKHPNEKDAYYHCILLYYLADIQSGALTNANAKGPETDYMGKPEWVALDRIESIKFSKSTDSGAPTVRKGYEIFKKLKGLQK